MSIFLKSFTSIALEDRKVTSAHRHATLDSA